MLSSLNKDVITVIILSFRTDMPGQTVKTQIRLLLEEQSGQGLHCLHSVCIVWIHYSIVEPHSSNFRVTTTNILMSEYLGNLRYYYYYFQLALFLPFISWGIEGAGFSLGSNFGEKSLPYLDHFFLFWVEKVRVEYIGKSLNV